MHRGIGVNGAVLTVSASRAGGPRFESRRLHSSFSLTPPDFVPIAPGSFSYKGLVITEIIIIIICTYGDALSYWDLNQDIPKNVRARKTKAFMV